MDVKTSLRGVEAFVVVLVIGLVSMITVGGQPLDISTPEGRSAAVTAIVSAILLAIRRAWASPSTPNP